MNTVVQRLDRVGQLLGPDWNIPAGALDTHLRSASTTSSGTGGH